MSSSQQSWDLFYKDAGCVWGRKPDCILLKYASLIPDGPILDLGIGDGRNAIFLAMQGYNVYGVDISKLAVEKCLERTRQSGVKLTCKSGNVIDFKIKPNSQALIMSTMTLQFMKKSEATQLISRIKKGIKPNGMVYLTVFSIDDPSYEKIKNRHKEIEPDTFYIEHMSSHLHFFNKHEILTKFVDFQLLNFAESMEFDVVHQGTSKPHYHGILSYLGRKPSNSK